jgi:hypothetical protein
LRERTLPSVATIVSTVWRLGGSQHEAFRFVRRRNHPSVRIPFLRFDDDLAVGVPTISYAQQLSGEVVVEGVDVDLTKLSHRPNGPPELGFEVVKTLVGRFFLLGRLF